MQQIYAVDFQEAQISLEFPQRKYCTQYFPPNSIRNFSQYECLMGITTILWKLFLQGILYLPSIILWTKFCNVWIYVILPKSERCTPSAWNSSSIYHSMWGLTTLPNCSFVIYWCAARLILLRLRFSTFGLSCRLFLHASLGNMSHQIKVVEEKTDWTYCMSFLISLINLFCAIASMSFPPKWIMMISGCPLEIIWYCKAGSNCVQCIPDCPNHTILYLVWRRFRQPIKQA